MTHYILIFILGTLNGVTTVEQEFDSYATCTMALAKIDSEYDSGQLRVWKISGGCYTK